MTTVNDVCLLSTENYQNFELNSNQYYLEPNKWRTLSPEMKRGSLHLYPTRFSNLSINDGNEDIELLNEEKCPSNSRNTCLFNSNYSREKKFISELHINIKEPSLDEGDNQYDLRQSLDSQRNPQKYNTLHSSEFQRYIGDHNNETDFAPRNSDHTPNLSEIYIKKKENHHSEKFIYLGGDFNQENQDYALQSYHSDIESSEGSRLHSTSKSDPSLINEDSKSFSSKSVQTSKKIDCIFKVTCEKGIETDAQKYEIKSGKTNKKKTINKHIADRCERTASSTSDNVCVEYSDSTEDCQHQKINRKTDQRRNIINCKPTRSYIQRLNKLKSHPMYTEMNQDTDAGSYSESFIETNEFLPNEEILKPYKCTSKKNSISRPDMMKGNKSNLNHPSVKICKRISEKVCIKKSNETVKRNNGYDIKSKMNAKLENEGHSFEIQCLLDNLNIHLENTVNSHRPKNNNKKVNNLQFSSGNSFWDNPLNPETNRSIFLNKHTASKARDINRRKTVNPEIQAIFETLEKPQNRIEKDDFGNKRQQETLQPEFNNRIINTTNDNHTIKRCEGMGSTDSLNDFKFPSNLKFQKCFELSPYDELVKSHLNNADRRIKSVAAKNGCQIIIDGPINMTDPTSNCQAIRSKLAYRCAVAGSSKDKLDKCLNYLKETFPNTCLRLQNRNNINMK